MRVGSFPFPTASKNLMPSNGSIDIWSSACGLLQNVHQLQSFSLNNSSSLRLREFFIRLCKHVLCIAVDHQRVTDVCRPLAATHVLLIILASCSCPSSLVRAFSSITSHFQLFGCSPHQNRWTCQQIDPRMLIDSPKNSQSRVINALQSSMEQNGNLHCGVASTCFTDWISPNFKLGRCMIDSDDALRVTI